MTEEKIALIDKICKFHPSLGVEKGWSNYTGGMMDSGKWHFRKMLDFPIEELQHFYDAQILEQEQWKVSQAKVKEDFKASGLTQHEWDVKKWQDLVDSLDKKMADMLFDSIHRNVNKKDND